MKTAEVEIYYSRILSIPMVGSLIYKLEEILYLKGLTDKLFLSNKSNPLRDLLFEQLNTQAKTFYCRSYRFGRFLSKIKGEIILDININPAKLSVPRLYDLMWTVVYCKTATRRTKISLKDFLPGDFAITDTIFIPLYENPDAVCDYVMQTAKHLLNLNQRVIILINRNPLWIGRIIFNLLKGKSKQAVNIFPREAHIIYAFKFFPERFFPHIMSSINKKILLFDYSQMINRVKRPILWSFDQRDLNLVNRLKSEAMTIYDCVDYWSLKDRNANRTLIKHENQLIRKVKYFFVNSQTLYQLKRKIRKDVIRVPLGFDNQSFGREQTAREAKRKTRIMSGKLNHFNHPRVIYIGTLSSRIDFLFLKKVISSLPEVSFIFTQSIKESDDDYRSVLRNTEDISIFPNVHFLPIIRDRIMIKFLIDQCDICIIPYDRTNKLNRYCFPMKVMEYFYCQKPVISTTISELFLYPDFITISDNPQNWVRIIRNQIQVQKDPTQSVRQREIALANSWEFKVKEILSYLN